MVTAERGSLQSHQRKARELSHRLDVIGGLEVDLKGLIDLERGIDVQRIRAEEARRAVQHLRTRLDTQNIEARGMEAKLAVSLPPWLPTDNELRIATRAPIGKRPREDDETGNTR